MLMLILSICQGFFFSVILGNILKVVVAMTGKEYLQACMIKLNVDNWYQLAKALDIKPQDVGFYMRGERRVSVYACFKVGVCLGIEPSIIIADIESECEKNPKKRHFFKCFLECMRNTVLVLVLSVSVLFTFQNERAFFVNRRFV
jgi:hypothetical protein